MDTSTATSENRALDLTVEEYIDATVEEQIAEIQKYASKMIEVWQFCICIIRSLILICSSAGFERKGPKVSSRANVRLALAARR